MNILFLSDWYPTPDFPQNGIFVRQHAQAAALKHRVGLVYVYGASQPSVTIQEDYGFTEFYVTFKKSSLAPLNAWRFLLAFFQGINLYLKHIGRPALCHANVSPRGAWQGLILKYRYGWQYVLSEHWTGFQTKDYHELSSVKKWAIKVGLRKAAVVLPVSKVLQRALMPLASASTRFEVLPNVLIDTHLNPLQAPSLKGFNIVSIGIDNYWKNSVGLIEAFKLVLNEIPEAHLHLGGGHPQKADLEDLVKHLGLTEKVTFYGALANEAVLKLIASGQVYVCNSNAESFSVTCIEAMLSGRPVIATRCGGPEEFVTPEVGCLIPVGNNEILAETIISFAKQDLSLTFPPAKLRAYAQSHFGMQPIAEKLDSIYRSIQSNNN